VVFVLMISYRRSVFNDVSWMKCVGENLNVWIWVSVEVFI